MNKNYNFSETEDGVNLLCFQHDAQKDITLKFISPMNWKHVIEVRKICNIFPFKVILGYYIIN